MASQNDLLTRLITLVRGLDDASWEALTSKGMLRRARKDLEAGLAVTRVTTGAKPVAPVEVEGHTELARSKYFVVDRFDMLAERSVPLGHANELQILIALEAGCTLIAEDGTSTLLPKAHAVVLPGEGANYSVLGGHEAEVIRVRR